MAATVACIALHYHWRTPSTWRALPRAQRITHSVSARDKIRTVPKSKQAAGSGHDKSLARLLPLLLIRGQYGTKNNCTRSKGVSPAALRDEGLYVQVYPCCFTLA